MAKNLVIVESPAKAKTIEGYLGKDFVVKSSYGHVRDLASNKLAIDIEKDFAPEYIVTPDKKKVIDELKKAVKSAEVVWLATDEDREGEAISWHLQEVLNLKPEKTKRIVFHEITKPAIIKAIENPRQVDVNLVNAQQARRVLDRLVGFELSPVLWRKVKPSLSAGRVQSVAVRIISEREKEIDAFTPQSQFRIQALLDATTGNIRADYEKRPGKSEDAEAILTDCKGKKFKVVSLEKKPGKRSPQAPFTTSTLQQEAGRKLGFPVAVTMQVAQKLYESGKITYMRTDSTNLSETAIAGAKAAIDSRYGNKYSFSRNYATKTKGAQEAHEAIRPTDFSAEKVTGTSDEKRLYELIWKRAIASQMSDAEIERTMIDFQPESTALKFVARGEVITFDGFLKVYSESSDDESSDDDESTLLPAVQVGQLLPQAEVIATQRFTSPPARYTEPSLVRKLEEMGIGRPSTYAPTISTIQKRGYVVKENREGKSRQYEILTLKNENIKKEQKSEVYGVEKQKLFPTDIGTITTDYLVENFQTILDYNFTANVEKEFDDIAEGLLSWTSMLEKFYGPFHDNVEEKMQHGERASGERVLGIDPASGKEIIARLGKFGPTVQIGGREDEDKKYARLKPGQTIQNLLLADALDLFKLPRTLGTLAGEEVSVGAGRFGPYVRHGKLYVSIPKSGGDDPMTIEFDRAVELIHNKKEADANAIINTFSGNPDIQVLNGRYGPYIKHGKNNYKIPAGKEAASLTHQEVLDIIEGRGPAIGDVIAEFEGKPKIQVLVGRYGPYIKAGKDNFKIPKGMEAGKLTLEEVKNIMEGKMDDTPSDAMAHFPGIPDVYILNGRFGPYIKAGKNNFKIPKGVEASALTEAEIRELIATTEPSGKKKTTRKKG
jgi:DNA topoisomerase I